MESSVNKECQEARSVINESIGEDKILYIVLADGKEVLRVVLVRKGEDRGKIVEGEFRLEGRKDLVGKENP